MCVCVCVQGKSNSLRRGRVPIMPVPDAEGEVDINQILNPPETHWQWDVPAVRPQTWRL